MSIWEKNFLFKKSLCLWNLDLLFWYYIVAQIHFLLLIHGQAAERLLSSEGRLKKQFEEFRGDPETRGGFSFTCFGALLCRSLLVSENELSSTTLSLDAYVKTQQIKGFAIGSWA